MCCVRMVSALLVGGALCAMARCTPPPGTFVVRFEWQGTPLQPNPGHYVHVAVKELGDGVEQTTLAAAVAPYVRESSLPLASIPHGSGRIVELRIRDGEDSDTSRVLAFGRSEAFDFLPGDVLEVPVEVALTGAPELVVEVLNGGADARLATSTVLLQYRASGATTLEAARDPQFQIDAQIFPLVESSGELSVDVCPTGCSDGPTRLYLRALTTEQIPSATVLVGLTIDRTPPTIVPGSTRISYEPSAENPLGRRAVGATPGTLVALSFVASELLKAPPIVTADGIDLTWTMTSSSGTGYGFVGDVSGVVAALDGDEFAPWVLLEDLAGNVSRIELIEGVFEVDNVPPAAPDDREMVYVRNRWGTEWSDGRPSYHVAVSREGVVRFGGTTLILFDPSGLEIGRANVSREGSTILSADGADRVTVAVAAVDDAGNSSARVAVRRTRWHATLAGKVAGSRAPNPHDLAIGSCAGKGHPLEQDLQVIAPELLSAVTRIGDDELSVTRRLNWRRRQRGVPPEPRHGHILVYDERRQRLVMNGGETNFNGSAIPATPETWEFDGGLWQVRDILAPKVLTFAAATYDRRHDLVLTFGGSEASGSVTNDFLSYDGSEWRRMTSAPPPRRRAGLVYRDSTGDVVLFGGCADAHPPFSATSGCTQDMDDTWVWSSDEWRRLPGSGPSGDTYKSTFDRKRQVVVALTDEGTWELDGDVWSNVGPSLTTATLNSDSLAYDPDVERVVFVQSRLFDEYRWTGSSWMRLADPNQGHILSSGPLAYVSHAGLLMGYGGFAVSGPQQTGYIRYPPMGWESIGWSAFWPERLSLHQLVFDTRNNRMLLAGGYGYRGNWYKQAYSYSRWGWGLTADLDATPAAQSGISKFVWTYDRGQQRLRVFGRGFPSVTVFEEGASGWTSFQPVDGPNVLGPVAVHDGRGTTVLVGDGALMEWDSGWNILTPATMTPDEILALVYDPDRDKVVAVASAGSRLETWEWDAGAQWTLTSTSGPPHRDRFAMTYDRLNRVALLSGGAAENFQARDDLWMWDGQAWSELPISVRFGARNNHAISVEESTGNLLLYGGTHSGYGFATDELWALDISTECRPWVEIVFNLSDAALPAAQLVAVEVGARAGGRGFELEHSTEGAYVEIWDALDGRWPQGVANATQTPESLQASLGLVSAQRSVAADGSLRTRVSTRAGGRLTRPPKLRLDYVELVAEYDTTLAEGESCGNGVPQPMAGEVCDDANRVDGDGCSSTCHPERGFRCSQALPSQCTICGDGILEGVESCDDGNTASGDGCNDRCQKE